MNRDARLIEDLLSSNSINQRADHVITIATNPASAKLAIKENAPCKGWEWK